MAVTVLAFVMDIGSRQKRRKNNRVNVFEMKFVDFFPVTSKRTNTHTLGVKVLQIYSPSYKTFSIQLLLASFFCACR